MLIAGSAASSDVIRAVHVVVHRSSGYYRPLGRTARTRQSRPCLTTTGARIFLRDKGSNKGSNTKTGRSLVERPFGI